MNKHLAITIPSSSANYAELNTVRRLSDAEIAERPDLVNWKFVTIMGERVQLCYTRREDLHPFIMSRHPDGHLATFDAVYLISQDEYDAFLRLEAERKAEDEARKIAELRPIMQRTVERAREQGGAMPLAAALKAQRDYNERHNDGGYGYVPHFITTDELVRAEKWLAEHPEN